MVAVVVVTVGLCKTVALEVVVLVTGMFGMVVEVVVLMWSGWMW